MINLIIPGEPVGKGRAKIYPIKTKLGQIIRAGVTPPKTANYENLIRQMFATKYPRFIPLEDPIVMEIDAYLSIPKSASKKKQIAMENNMILPTKKPDIDNIAKLSFDALESVAYRNDSSIIDAKIRKLYSKSPRMEIRVYTVYDLISK